MLNILRVKALVLSVLLLSACGSGGNKGSSVDAAEQQNASLNISEQLESNDDADSSLLADQALASLKKEMLIARSNDLGFQLLHKQSINSNYIISTSNIVSALSVMAGSNDAWTIDDLFSESLEPNALSFLSALSGVLHGDNAELSTIDEQKARVMWRQYDLTLDATFLKTLNETFGVLINESYFADDVFNSALAIDQWLNEMSGGLLCCAGISPSSNTRLVFNDLSHLTIPWVAGDVSSEIVSKYFFAEEGFAVPMKQEVEFYKLLGGLRIHNDDEYLASELKLDGHLNVLFVMPKTADIRNALNNIDAAVLEKIDAELEELTSTIYVPKISMTFNQSLNAVLAELGVDAVFKEENDVGLVSDALLYVDQIVSDVSLDINHEGITSIGATSVALNHVLPYTEKSVSSIYVSQEIEGGKAGCLALAHEQGGLIFDRPFFFFIRDANSKLIHYLGKVSTLGPGHQPEECSGNGEISGVEEVAEVDDLVDEGPFEWLDEPPSELINGEQGVPF